MNFLKHVFLNLSPILFKIITILIEDNCAIKKWNFQVNMKQKYEAYNLQS